MTQRYAYPLILICLASLAAAPAKLEAQAREPYSIEQVIQLIESGLFTDSRILALVRESCIGFRLDEEATRRISEAGGSAELLGGLRDVCSRGFVQAVIVAPAELDMEVGGTGILRAQAMAPDSTPIAGIPFEWVSADTAVAEVSGGGMVLAKAPGEARIAATTQEGPSGSALVRVTAAALAEPVEAREARAVGGKSVGTAAALGVVVPGGGQFYTGSTGKGAAVLAGSAAALAAGYLITSDEVLSVSYSATQAGDCSEPGSCTFEVTKTEEVKTTRNLVYGAVAAGAVWVYGLIDGIRSAKNSQIAPAEGQDGATPGISLELAPADGVRYTAFGEVELTFIRIRS
jgi:hypothetical protein